MGIKKSVWCRKKKQYEMNENRRISRLILIEKSGKIVEIFRQA